MHTSVILLLYPTMVMMIMILVVDSHSRKVPTVGVNQWVANVSNTVLSALWQVDAFTHFHAFEGYGSYRQWSQTLLASTLSYKSEVDSFALDVVVCILFGI